jgi:transposase
LLVLEFFNSLLPENFEVVEIVRQSGAVVISARSISASANCPTCDRSSGRVHSHYLRRLADLPFQDQAAAIRLRARRFRCVDRQCVTRIFTERFPGLVSAKARRTNRLRAAQTAVGLTAGGEPGSRLSQKLTIPVSGDTLLRMVSSSVHESYPAPRIVGIDDWAWRKGQRYGTIVCDLERNRVLDLLPERNADVVAEWLARHPGVEIIARDRAGVYAEGARRGAPDAAQIADRWHLLANLGEALRLAVGRHRKAVRLGGVAAMNEIAAGSHEVSEHPSRKQTSLQSLRHQRKLQRRDLYEEVMRLRDAGITSARQIAPQVGMSVRTIERWLAAGGEPEHHRPSVQYHTLLTFEDYLLRRWNEGCHNGRQLLSEIKTQGFKGSRATVYRWIAALKKQPQSSKSEKSRPWRPPSRRACAWLLGQEPQSCDAKTECFLKHVYEYAPQLSVAGHLSRRLAAILRGDDASLLEGWIAEAGDSELASLAAGISRDIEAVRGAINHRWTTSPVEGQINRLKTLKRQMYGRAGYALLRSRVLMAA